LEKQTLEAHEYLTTLTGKEHLPQEISVTSAGEGFILLNNAETNKSQGK
jgi:hypothetical protein